MSRLFKRLGAFILAAGVLCNTPCFCMQSNATEDVEVISASEETGEVGEADDTEEISGEIEVILNRSEEDMRKYIDAFESKYPQVTVTYTSYANYEGSIRKRVESGDYGDVLFAPAFIGEQDMLHYFESLGNVVRLKEKYNYIDYSRYLNSSVYGIPSSAYLSGIIYNKEVFDKAGITELPKTMDEFLYAMYLIKEHTDAIPFYSGAAEDWMMQYWETFQFIEMTGNPAYKYGSFIVEENPFREGTVHYKALHFLYDLVSNGYTEQGVKNGIAWAQSVQMIADGEMGCTAIGTWAFTNYKRACEDSRNIGYMPFPNTVDGKQYATVSVDYCYSVAKNSENKEAAKAFVFFMLDESGYAVDQDAISILKTDPYPECYSGMTQTAMRNSIAPSTSHYSQFLELSTKLNLSNGSEYVRIVEAASGKREETFDEIMEDWNARWESSRKEDMITTVKENPSNKQEDVLNIDNREILLSENELLYIQQNPVIRVGYHANMAPLSFVNKDVFCGASFDVCDLIREVTGVTMEYHGYANTEELVQALQNGEIDMIAGIEKTVDDRGIRYSKEYLSYMDVIVRHSTVDALSQNRLAGVGGEPLGTKQVAQEPILGESLGECMQMVQNMQADYLVTNYYSANYYMKERGCVDVTILPYTADRTYHIGFAEDADPTLIAICNKCIYSIQDGEMLISLMDYMDTIVESITLETYIAANPMQSLLIVAIVITVIFGTICLIFFERGRANRKQALEAKKHERLAELAEESFFEYDCKKQQLVFDTQFREEYKYPEVIHKNQFDAGNPFLVQFFEQVDKSLSEKKTVQFTISLDGEENTKQWYRVVTTIIFDKRNQPIHLIGKLVNIQREMEEVANYQKKAHRDPLTGLYNRDGFKEHMPDETAGVTFAVMDMDNFKSVNDTLGHDGGDYALTYFARNLEKCLEEVGMVGRYGGDEFIAMLIDVPVQQAEAYLENLVRTMDVDMDYEGKTRHISISVGAIYTFTSKPFEELFKEADDALYETKTAGKNNYTLRIKE